MPKDPDTLITPLDLKKQFPLNDEQRGFISSCRKTISSILNGNDQRLLCIIGPCSIHDITSAKEYASKLKILANRLSDHFFIVMRTYLEKPRTGLDWKGHIYDPHINNTHDIRAGLASSRQLLLDLATLEIPAATEFLDIATVYYLNDLISWGCIGARTSASQIHRQMSSGLEMPIGFKNNTDGNIQIAVDGARASAAPHTYIGINQEGQAALFHTNGNPDCHIVLRGGRAGPNFDSSSINTSANLLKRADLQTGLLVDCSHDNSFKQHERQIEVLKSVLDQYLNGNTSIRGILLESHLFAGQQALTKPLRYGVSITDACLDWKATENLMQWAYDRCKSCEVIHH